MELRLLSSTLLAVAYSVGAWGQYVNSTLKHDHRRIRTVLVLPAQVTVNRFGFRGSVGLWEESDRFEDEFTVVVARVLSGYGADVSRIAIGRGMTEDAKVRLADLQRLYDGVDSQIIRKRQGIAKGRFTLGDSVTNYAPSGSADAIVFVRGTGELPAGVGGSFARHMRFEGRLAFVDTHSGTVLAFLEFTCDGHPWPTTTTKLVPHIQEMIQGGSPPIYEFLGPARR